MSDTSGGPELFPAREDKPAADVVELRGTGILPYQRLRAMIESGDIDSLAPIAPDQVQPASIDLRLGTEAFRVRASFLPGRDATIMSRVQELDGFPAIDITNGAVLEKGGVYVVKLLESVRLAGGIEGAANPKSSTGRLDVLTRLITDHGVAFDRIERGYKGPLYAEIAPLSFNIIVRPGTRLNQVRFHKGAPALAGAQVDKYYAEGKLLSPPRKRPVFRDGLVPVTVDLLGKDGGVIGYKAKKYTNKIDVDRIGHYDPREFWEKIQDTGGRINLDKDDFYILATCEDVGVPPELAAEMVPYDTSSGEFRVHYAGFFDPGFGWSEGGARGSKAVLEVRSYGVSFTLEHGQTVGWLRYSKLAHGRPDKIYGAGIRSNYQGQGVALAKQFKAWPG